MCIKNSFLKRILTQKIRVKKLMLSQKTIRIKNIKSENRCKNSVSMTEF